MMTNPYKKDKEKFNLKEEEIDIEGMDEDKA